MMLVDRINNQVSQYPHNTMGNRLLSICSHPSLLIMKTQLQLSTIN
jgi:hypothetical protein